MPRFELEVPRHAKYLVELELSHDPDQDSDLIVNQNLQELVDIMKQNRAVYRANYSIRDSK